MTNMQYIRGIRWIVFALIGSVAPLFPAEAPVRLGINVGPTTIKVGGRATITVQFLNKDFRPVRSDRDRHVRLQTRPTGGRTEGKGTIAPPTVRIGQGAESYSQIQLSATTEGTLRVWAESDGLEPAEALVRVTSTTSSLWQRFIPVLHAQTPDGPFELLPAGDREVVFSPSPAVQFGIVVDRPLAQKRQWKITTTPAVRIRFDGLATEGYAVIG